MQISYQQQYYWSDETLKGQLTQKTKIQAVPYLFKGVSIHAKVSFGFVSWSWRCPSPKKSCFSFTPRHQKMFAFYIQ